ncbi:GSCOCT00013863001.3-RA-CDS [Cotesia congregata]|uniref:Gustatory receptor n=1 Tax=Cotesia congregata TaxID=51543 RepID=A0A8J2HRG5_COTCN|nr:GSCOCT00013863001.3-RA-CDS [Cotesia congregata]CAG5104164.1 gustatory receptor 10 [Cotesia congregata]
MYQSVYGSVHQRNLIYVKYIFFKILGLAPWKFNLVTKQSKNQTAKTTICKFSYLGLLYNVLLTTSVFLMTSYFCHQHNSVQAQVDSLVTPSTMMNLQYFAVLLSSSVFLNYTCRQKDMIGIFNEIIKIDKSLQKYTFNSAKNGDIIINLIFLGHLITCSTLICLQFFFLQSFWLAVLRCWPAFLYCWVIVQYTIMLDMMEKRFKFINLNIVKLGEIKANPEASEPLFTTKLVFLRESVLYDVINMKDTYNKLCDICNNISDFYGLSFLKVFMYHGTSTILILYFMLVAYYESKDFHLLLFIKDIVFVLWMVFQIVILTTYVNKTINKSEETPNIINTLMSRCAMHEKVEKELINFLRELSFRKVKFTAWGIISIDRSLLATVNCWHSRNLSHNSHPISY